VENFHLNTANGERGGDGCDKWVEQRSRAKCEGVKLVENAKTPLKKTLKDETTRGLGLS